ncbi:hypothetical protein [Amycolatopsis sp. NPDC059657]|uniref:hypothetical protein n=1 Tax=Amycolatopsis sp. NPDC059657 TaxID=3346899 RepID=UPI00366DFBCD
MAVSRITWTPVPNGYAGGKLRLSVLISPRLLGGGTLGTYPEWLTWPAERPRFEVTFGGAAVPATVDSPAPRLDLWKALFSTTTPVTVKTDLRARASTLAANLPVIRSWPSSRARDIAAIEHITTLAENPTSPPTVYERAPQGEGRRGGGGGYHPANSLHLSTVDKKRAMALIDIRLREDGFFAGGPLSGELPGGHYYFDADQVDFLLAEVFHSRSANSNPRGGGARSLTAHGTHLATAQDMDFHVALSSFAQYPKLQRALGLIVDLSVDPAAAGIPAPGPDVVLGLKVTWSGGNGPYESVYPQVSAIHTASEFRAKPSGDTQRGGLLRLDDTTRYDLVEVDADASAGVLTTFSQTYQQRDRNAQYSNAPGSGVGVNLQPDPGRETAALPALRSNGFSVVQRDRAEQLYNRVKTNAQRASGALSLAANPFSAEDLTHGIRVDVWDDTAKKWFSLCRRAGTYTFDGLTFTADDEGVLTLAHTQSPDGDPTVYLHESLFRWSGYSLVANRPGSTEETANGQTVTVGPDSAASGPIRMATSFRPSGLPKLRYGRDYRFRARVVDIAGNSHGLDTLPPNDFSSATRLMRYLRFEPVPSPLLLPTAPRTEAESVHLMVIRGNYDAPAREENRRQVVPRRTGQRMAEQHGRYDVPPSVLNPGGIDTLAYREIVRRDAGDLAAAGKSDPDGWGGEGYYPDRLLDVPYLADVLSRGAAFTGLPGLGPDEVFTVDFDDLFEWPARVPFRIRLKAGTGRPDYNRAARELTVLMPPGRTARVGVSSRLADAELAQLGVWDWFVRSGRSSDIPVAELRKLAVKGQLWQLTPSVELGLVHASRQPIRPPSFDKPILVRQPGQTTARLIDVVGIDRQSTASLAVFADWTEPTDVLGEPKPGTLTGSLDVARLTANGGSDEGDKLELGELHEFHDTKHRTITYSAVAASRFTEFFVQRKDVTLRGTTPVKLTDGAVGAGSVTLTDPESGKTYQPGTGKDDETGGDYVADVAAGTVARTAKGSAIADGATVTASFVPGSITRGNTEAQQPIVLNLRSSARPSAPDIAYLVPTFGWERGTDGGRVASTRRGNGVRVYLRRPWYSSGEGEQLGVVLFDGKGTMDPRLRQYVTLRAQDPLFASARVPGTPGMAEFPLAVNAKPGYRLAESETLSELTQTVAVAPHRVGYDEGRGLWYCDVTVTEGAAYTPFVRFAFARFQADSLSGVELSPVVLAQFAQLSPDRALSMVSTPGQPAGMTLTLAGTTYSAGGGRSAVVTVAVQVADPKPMGPLGWRTVSTTDLVRSGEAWSGKVTLPAARGSAPMRLIVEERERFSHGGTRLVYADAVEI